MTNTTHLLDALAKLRWSASGEFSASLKPQECQALLSVLPDDKIVIKSLGAKDNRDMSQANDTAQREVSADLDRAIKQDLRFLTGDPGDEHPE